MGDEELSFVGWLVAVCGADFCSGISLTLFIGLIISLSNIASKNRSSAAHSVTTLFAFLPLGIGILAAVKSLRMTLQDPPELREAGYGIMKVQLTIAVFASGFLAIMALIYRRRSSHRNGTIDNTTDSKQDGPY